jgi:hypothetical protein
MRVHITIDEAGEDVSIERPGADEELAGAEEAAAAGAGGGPSAGRVPTGRGGFNPAGLPETGAIQRSPGDVDRAGIEEPAGPGGGQSPAMTGARAPGPSGVGGGGLDPQPGGGSAESYPIAPRRGLKPSTIDLYVGNQM